MRGHIAQIHQRNLIAQSIVKSGQHVVDPMAIATCNATRLTQQEIAKNIDPLKASVKAMTMGKGSFGDWVRMSTAYNVSMAIEQLRIVRGYKGVLQELKTVLDAIGVRAGGECAGWKSPTLYAEEIKVLRMQASDYKFQISQLSYGEYTQAYDLAVKKVRGGQGEVFSCEELQ